MCLYGVLALICMGDGAVICMAVCRSVAPRSSKVQDSAPRPPKGQEGALGKGNVAWLKRRGGYQRALNENQKLNYK